MSETVALIKSLEQRLRQATLRNDVAEHDTLLADNWMNTGANGGTTIKSSLLTLLASQPFKFVSIDDEDTLIRTYQHTAVVTGKSIRKREGKDGDVITQVVRFTRVWIQHDDTWQVVAAQATPITQ